MDKFNINVPPRALGLLDVLMDPIRLQHISCNIKNLHAIICMDKFNIFVPPRAYGLLDVSMEPMCPRLIPLSPQQILKKVAKWNAKVS